MSHRKLTHRQAVRAKQHQQQRVARASRQQRDLTVKIQSGELSSEQRGLVVCRYSQHFDVLAREGDGKGDIYQCVTRKNLGSIVTGDHVIWRSSADLTGVIESRLERRSLLERPDNFGRLKGVAANVDQMLIVIAPQPQPQANLIDRYLVAAHLKKIHPIIVLNKSDLIDTNNHVEIEDLLHVYQSLGYHTEMIMCPHKGNAKAHNLDPLLETTHNLISIIVGQSGVGKSSLINALLPDVDQAIGELSSNTNEGAHTTTQATLFQLPNGGQIIDSPGIRDFSLWHIDIDQLQQGFIEIASHLGACRFRDCQHEQEPGCAVLNAVDNGTISATRFNSYQRIKAGILEQQARGFSVPN